MSILSRLFGKGEASSEVLCPHCERAMGEGHNPEVCARKKMSRRFFLGALGGAAAAVAVPAVVPKWIGIDLASGPSVTGNVLLTPEVLSRMMLETLRHSIVRGSLQMQRDYNQLLSMQVENFRIGDVVQVRRPPRFSAS